MKNKTVIITGASTGIGKAVAAYFIERESNVVMNSANENNLKNAYHELGSPVNAIYFVGDISNQNTGKELVRLAKETFGSVDVLINNAGVFAPKPFLEVIEEDLERY
ncbi:hypothetical protein GCM10009430_39590 [Aquimarina litoralis]|uniref:Short chain dehydrogenase n=1 Tax=Aquimarina litoralis TaxID=584605 RepID=A0ABP3UGJ0_9FLAO